jgi:hypothetical protein
VLWRGDGGKEGGGERGGGGRGGGPWAPPPGPDAPPLPVPQLVREGVAALVSAAELFNSGEHLSIPAFRWEPPGGAALPRRRRPLAAPQRSGIGSALIAPCPPPPPPPPRVKVGEPGIKQRGVAAPRRSGSLGAQPDEGAQEGSPDKDGGASPAGDGTFAAALVHLLQASGPSP